MAGLTSLRRSFALQRRIIFALLMRETLTRYGRHNIGFLWLFVEPMTFTLGVTLLWGLMRATHGSDLPITVFALTGYSCVLLWRNMPARTIGAVQPSLSLMFHRNVKIIDIYIARMLLETAGASMSFTILSVVFIGLEMISPPENMLKVFAAWMMLIWFSWGLGLFLGVLAERTELVEKFWHPLSYLIFPLSGAVFLVHGLPPAMREIVLYIPVVHCVELLRDGYFGSHFTAIYDMWYVLFFNLGLTILGLAQLRYVSKTIIPQ